VYKIARIVYHLLTYGDQFVEERAVVYEHHCHVRDLRHLNQRAAKLGYILHPPFPRCPEEPYGYVGVSR
jgi:23S rRNA maturation-related 3'-5' exoribonuclease YhaM